MAAEQELKQEMGEMKKKLVLFLNFFWNVLILSMYFLKFKNMTTTIRTSSKNYFTKIQKYLKNKRVFFASSSADEVYTLIIFDLSSIETTSLINKMTKHFHLTNRQEPLALAA